MRLRQASTAGQGMQQKAEPKRVRSLSFGLERLGLTALRFPYIAAGFILLATVVALFGISRLRVDDSLSELFRTDTPEFRDYEVLSERFPSSEYDVLIVVTGDKLPRQGSRTGVPRQASHRRGL